MWLFDLSILDKEIGDANQPTTPLTIIINNINNMEVLLRTIDGIKESSSPDLIHIILFSSIDDDLKSIINPYSKSFKKIDIYKTNKFDYDDLNMNNINTELILIINSGMYFSNKFLAKSLQYINNFNLSILFTPIHYLDSNRKNIFHQLFEYLKQAIQCSLINKNLYSFKRYNNNGFFINKQSFSNFLNGDRANHVPQKYIVDSDLCIKQIGLNSTNNITFNYLYMIYFGINCLYFFIITQFLSAPSIYYLATIIIKIIPELYYIYSYYNRLKIKFPKIEFIIYSIFIPLYMMGRIFPNMTSGKELS